MPAQPALEGEKAMRDMVHGTALCLMNKQGTIWPTVTQTATSTGEFP